MPMRNTNGSANFILILLISRFILGGDPNLCSLSKTASPLFEACKEKQVKCALTLLRYGADPHVPNCEGLYPLHMACQKGLLE